MTKEQKYEFAKKVEILYDRDVGGLSFEQLSEKYKISIDMVKVFLKLGNSNYKVIQEVKKKTDANNKEKV